LVGWGHAPSAMASLLKVCSEGYGFLCAPLQTLGNVENVYIETSRV